MKEEEAEEENMEKKRKKERRNQKEETKKIERKKERKIREAFHIYKRKPRLNRDQGAQFGTQSCKGEPISRWL